MINAPITYDDAARLVHMLAANFDKIPWDDVKLETWQGMLLEVYPDQQGVYSLREATWATKFLIRHHPYPHLQFNDFHRAVIDFRGRVKTKMRELKDATEAKEFRALKGERRRSIGPLLRLAAPRKIP